MERLATAKDEESTSRDRLCALGAMAGAIDSLYLYKLPDIQRAAEAGDGDAQLQIEWAPSLITPLLDDGARILQQELLPQLTKRSIRVVSTNSLSSTQLTWLADYFQRTIFPLLTPLVVDAGHPFPRIDSGAVTLLAELRILPADSIATDSVYACVNVPRFVPRLIRIPALAGSTPEAGGGAVYVWREEVVACFVEQLFSGIPVVDVYQFRILRARREPARVIRLDVESVMPNHVSKWLVTNLAIPGNVIVRNRSPLAMVELNYLADLLPTQPAGQLRRWFGRLVQTVFGHIQ